MERIIKGQAKVGVELDCFALPVLFKSILSCNYFSYGIKPETSGATGRARQVREYWSMYVGHLETKKFLDRFSP